MVYFVKIDWENRTNQREQFLGKAMEWNDLRSMLLQRWSKTVRTVVSTTQKKTERVKTGKCIFG